MPHKQTPKTKAATKKVSARALATKKKARAAYHRKGESNPRSY